MGLRHTSTSAAHKHVEVPLGASCSLLGQLFIRVHSFESAASLGHLHQAKCRCTLHHLVLRALACEMVGFITRFT